MLSQSGEWNFTGRKEGGKGVNTCGAAFKRSIGYTRVLRHNRFPDTFGSSLGHFPSAILLPEFRHRIL